MFKGIIINDTNVTANQNIPFDVMRNTNANTRYDSTTNEIVITKPGYYDVTATIVASSVGGGTVTAQLYANGRVVPGALSTEVIDATGTTTFVIIDNVKVDPSPVNEYANISIRFSAEITVNDANILVEMRK